MRYNGDQGDGVWVATRHAVHAKLWSCVSLATRKPSAAMMPPPARSCDACLYLLLVVVDLDWGLPYVSGGLL